MVQVRVVIEDPDAVRAEDVRLGLLGGERWSGAGDVGDVVFDVPEDLEDDAVLALHVLGYEARASWRELRVDPVVRIARVAAGSRDDRRGSQLGWVAQDRPEVLNAFAPELNRGPAQILQAPDRPGFRFRLNPDDAEDVRLAAGRPTGGTFPVDEVGIRYTVHFLEPDVELQPGGGVTEGVCREFETHWEPLGWALEDWISTTRLGPAQDGIASELSVRGITQLAEEKAAGIREAAQAEAATTGSTRESMSLGTSSVGTSRGVHVGLGGASEGSSTRILADPVATLVNAVTGAFQFGYSSGSATNRGTSDGDLTRAITSGISQASTQMRQERAESLVRSAADLSESRSLHAVVNPSATSATNLAVFSVVRQWLVSTAEVAQRPAVFVPIDRLTEDFTTRDVFLHRDLLRPALLDKELEGTLEGVAERWVPPATAPEPVRTPTQPTVQRLVGHLILSDAGKGWKSGLLIGAQILVGGAVHSLDPVRLEMPPVGERADFEIPIRPGRCTADQIQTVTIEFDNPGFIMDSRAEISELQLEAMPPDGTPQSLGEWSAVVLRAGALERLATTAARSPSRPAHELVPEPESVPAPTARVLAHLNHHRAFYRLALDLQADAVTRYARLRERFPSVGALPRDMRPLGVVGTHLAFRAVSSDSIHEVIADPRVTRELISMPSAATWLEAVSGASVVTGESEGRKTAVPFTEATWPSATQLTTAAVSSYVPGAVAAGKVEPHAEAADGISAALAKFSMDLATGLGGVLDAAVKEATKAAEAAKPPATSAADEPETEPAKPAEQEGGAPADSA